MFWKLYVLTLPIFFAIDMVWLGLVAKNFYQRQIGFLMRPDVQWPAALIFYFLFIAGLVYFVISPAIEKRQLLSVIGPAALFGLVTYATYDLTNLATLKNWPIIVTIVDLCWGMVLSILVSVVTVYFATRFRI